jgi:hypothetical protein
MPAMAFASPSCILYDAERKKHGDRDHHWASSPLLYVFLWWDDVTNVYCAEESNGIRIPEGKHIRSSLPPKSHFTRAHFRTAAGQREHFDIAATIRRARPFPQSDRRAREHEKHGSATSRKRAQDDSREGEPSATFQTSQRRLTMRTKDRKWLDSKRARYRWKVKHN